MSASSAWRSSARCCAKCTPSTAASAPTSWTRRMSSAAGGIVPTAFDASVNATSRVLSLSAASNESRSSVTSSVADVHPADGGAGVLGRQDPRTDVRVVVERGDDHLVARAERAAERAREVQQQRRRVRPEDDLARVGARDVGCRPARVRDQRVGLLAGRERPVRVADPAPQVRRRSRRSPSPGPASRPARRRR